MMRKITFAALALFLAVSGLNAQEKDPKQDLSCYHKWQLKFDERGAEEVTDGFYTDVVISFRTGSTAECFSGKVEVKDKKVASIFILLEDGTYEVVNRVWKNDIKNIRIFNGMSEAMITKDNQLINVIWVKKLKPKKASYKKAPDPEDE